MKLLVNHIALISIMSIITSICYAQTQDGCSLKKDSDGIKVYSCKSNESAFKVVKASFTLNSTINKYLKLVRDVENYKNWHYKSSNARILKSNSPNDIIYYTQVQAPWPVSNRDLILHLQLQLDSATGSLTVLLNSLPDYLPEVKDLVRVPYSTSTMIMTPINDHQINVQYTILANPGGQLPVWVVNLVSAQGPYETFKNLKDILEIKSNVKRQMSDQ